MDPKYKSLFSNTIIFGIGNFTTKIIYFFLMPIYTLTLTTSEFGVADLLNNSLQLVLPILTISITEAVFRFSLDKGVDYQSLLSNAFRVLLISYVLVASGVVVIYSFSHYSYWLYFGLLYAVDSLKMILAQFTRGIGRVKEYAVNGILGAAVLLTTTYIFLSKLHLSVNGYLLSFILADLVSIIYLIFFVKIKDFISISKSDKILMKEMIVYSLPLIPNTMFWWLTNVSSRYVIAAYCGIGLSGLFSAASKLPALINVFSSVFQLSWQYASVKEYQESKESLFYSSVLKYYSAFILVCGSIIICLIPFISKIILKGVYYEAWTYTPLLVFAAILGCYSIYFGTFYSAVKKNKGAMYSTLLGAIINLVLCIILIPCIGIWGALIGAVSSYIGIVIMRYRDAIKYVTLKIDYLKIIVGLCLILGESVILTFNFNHAISLSFIFPVLLMIVYNKEILNLKINRKIKR